MALFRFLLLDTMVNYLFSLSLRAATFSDHENWSVRAVLSMISIGGSPGVVWVGCFVVTFVGLGPLFVCCWDKFLGRLVWMALDVLAVLVLFRFGLFARKLTKEARETI